ncbi:MAG: hypothetical protein QM658_03255 [Gordonia sp. (in: high G+C Gram-positive bacteria)]
MEIAAPVASAVIALLALSFSIWSWYSATQSRAARADAEQARADSEAARDAAHAQAERIGRMADALEQANAARPPWRITPNNRSQYTLANTSGVNAGDVVVDTRSPAGEQALGAIGAGSEAVFLVMRTGSFEGTVVVTWTTPDGLGPHVVQLALP